MRLPAAFLWLADSSTLGLRSLSILQTPDVFVWNCSYSGGVSCWRPTAIVTAEGNGGGVLWHQREKFCCHGCCEWPCVIKGDGSCGWDEVWCFVTGIGVGWEVVTLEMMWQPIVRYRGFSQIWIPKRSFLVFGWHPESILTLIKIYIHSIISQLKTVRNIVNPNVSKKGVH